MSKANKYHHVKSLDNIKTLLRDNIRLEALLPRMRAFMNFKHLFSEKM